MFAFVLLHCIYETYESRNRYEVILNVIPGILSGKIGKFDNFRKHSENKKKL